MYKQSGPKYGIVYVVPKFNILEGLNPQEEKEEEDDKNKSPNSEGANSGPGKKEEQSSEGERTFSQKELDHIVAKAKREAIEAIERKERDRKEKEAQAKLEEEGKYVDLYNSTKKTNEELQAELSKYQETNKKIVASMRSQIEAFPEEIKALCPVSEDVDVLSSWIEKVTPLLEKLKAPAAPNIPTGNDASAGLTKLRSSFYDPRKSNSEKNK